MRKISFLSNNFCAIVLLGAFFYICFLSACVIPVRPEKEDPVTSNTKPIDTLIDTTAISYDPLIDTNKITLKWIKSRLGGEFAFYKIEISGKDTNNNTIPSLIFPSPVYEQDINAIQRTFSGLRTGSSYGFRISTYDTLGNVRAFDEILLKTPMSSTLQYIRLGTYEFPYNVEIIDANVSPDGSPFFLATNLGVYAIVSMDENVLKADPPRLIAPQSGVKKVVSTINYVFYFTADSIYRYNRANNLIISIPYYNAVQIRYTPDQSFIYIATPDSIKLFDVNLQPTSAPVIHLTNKGISDFIFHKNNANFLYIATSEGVYKYDRMGVGNLQLILSEGEKDYTVLAQSPRKYEFYYVRRAKNADAGALGYYLSSRTDFPRETYTSGGGTLINHVSADSSDNLAFVSESNAYLYSNNRVYKIPAEYNTSAGFTKTLFLTEGESLFVGGRNKVSLIEWFF